MGETTVKVINALATLFGVCGGSAGLFAFCKFMIERKDKKQKTAEDKADAEKAKNDIEAQDIAMLKKQGEETVKTVEEMKATLSNVLTIVTEQNETIKIHTNKIDATTQDSIRTQLLVLMTDYPENIYEILTLAHDYFVVHNGDYYMTPMFNDFLTENQINCPAWFLEHRRKEEIMTLKSKYENSSKTEE